MASRRQVALLRGIGAGRAKRVAMADLRKLIEGLGCRDVKTLLNSGNVVFSCPDGAAAAMGKVPGDAVTTRNWSTISKLHLLASQKAA